jgi:hypothetical protein
MSHEISRMFGSQASADSAAAELLDEGFDEIHVVHGTAGAKKASKASIQDIALQIARGNVHMPDALIYAEGVAKGKSLVTVHVPFGRGRKAESILRSYDPVDSGIPEPVDAPVWDEATPVSCVLGLPVLLDDPAPFSRMWNIAPLASDSYALSSAIGMPLLSGSGDIGTGRWGFRFLSDNPAPLSSLLGLPLLTKPKQAW